jgi:hypothetical protein
MLTNDSASFSDVWSLRFWCVVYRLEGREGSKKNGEDSKENEERDGNPTREESMKEI